ncbi:hypothetical protein PF005_g25474 [Phytophthora fragariae]|uniref:Uncharacterized protein n=1 Tax=Phytophthora fragariae TaxID=53985 RepID=A0A6A3QIH1_9STRA|nr:hypothetical protein PF003_g25072 [Phytophthora fragariae]KAE8923564.1 hypothetical protein PF009_g26186 [Phytophthora fragariae]KAE8977620.1 hypothetical protein PF011_g23583 [Phytophthora fragariae]KAE9075574.1 hypothetical protein PF010_g24248 [Phytophthora fragariae]KAE9075870.1 hypothetical protein PF007_g24839 [Phytophthora fragariae]
MSTTVSTKGPNALQRRTADSASQSAANPLWDFYACGLVNENEDCSEGEDTEDELETQDYILFQRQRAQARLASAKPASCAPPSTNRRRAFRRSDQVRSITAITTPAPRPASPHE